MQRPPLKAPHLIRLAVFGGLAVAMATATMGQPTHRATRRSQPVPTSHAAPDMTATIPSPPSQKPAAAAPDDETLPAPFNLPVASRAHMRACGEKWQGIKMSGNAADETWREFATKCLADKDDATAKGR